MGDCTDGGRCAYRSCLRVGYGNAGEGPACAAQATREEQRSGRRWKIRIGWLRVRSCGTVTRAMTRKRLGAQTPAREQANFTVHRVGEAA